MTDTETAAPPRTPTVPSWFNVIVRAVLRGPAHRLMSRSTILLSFTGRRTGTAYTFPVRYHRDGDVLTCFTDHGWWRNLRGGAPVTVVLAGRRRPATGEAVPQDHADTLASLRTFLDHTGDARYYGVRTGPDGAPDAADLDRAAHHSTMVRIRLAPR